MSPFLRRVRRRLRAAWVVATLHVVAPIAALGAVAILLLGRLVPVGSSDGAALALLVAPLLVAVASMALRLEAHTVARAADRGLGTGDVFATALELDGTDGPLPDAVVARAQSVARSHHARDAVPLHVDARRLAGWAGLTALAVALLVVHNPQDDVRRRLAAERERVTAAAERLAEAAEEIESRPEAASVAAELRALARSLERTPRATDALGLLDGAAVDLASRVDAGLLAERAAVRGLERTLEQRPLVAGGEDVAAQLETLAGALDELSPEEQNALAERLAALAATQGEGSPAVADALRTAAAEVGDGNLDAAARALAAAGVAHAGARGHLGSQEAAAEGLGAISAAAGALAGSAEQAPHPSGSGSPGGGEAPGQGGSGQAEGQGQGEGQGEAQGGGQGQGQGGAGGASGRVGGATSPTGAGRGGPGTPDGSGANASVGVQESASVFDPGGSDGEPIRVDATPGEGPSEVTGRGDGPTTQGDIRVPVSSVLPRYRAEASLALDRLAIPASVRAIVRAYFESLGSTR